MTPERYEVVRQIFDDVCDLPDAEREAAIDRACGADVELAAEVRTLLEHDAGATTSGDVEVHGFDLDDESVDEGLPERIGQYRVVRRIGAGGMGVVYEAQQDEPRRSVAIKILRADPAVTAIMRRFQREVHVLGLLRHSGIAQVYDAGRIETATGPRAYFAMEFVDGEPILEYARRCDLSVPDRLELVRRLCDAVQHAHAKGVVHRDLKPSNILVMADGQPKILDFGVARLMDPEGRGTSLHTQVGQLIGTLPYMSPEQASGVPDAVDTRSDVYALGILLYELLAARPPYELADKMMHEALRVIQEDEPESLSRIERSLRGDVDTIVATALAKDKERRYQTASALSEDIRRFLDNEPIAARPPSAMYHLGKLVRRHRVAAALLTALVVVSIAFGIIGTVQAGQLRDASGRIAKESEEKSRRLYVSQIAQANLLRSDYNLEQMDAVLEACEEKRRGWEWRWLRTQVKPYRLEMTASQPVLVAAGRRGDDFVFVEFHKEYVLGRLALGDAELFRLKRINFISTSAALSSDGELFALGDSTGVARVWRVETGELVWEQHLFDKPIGTIVFSSNQSTMVVANNGPQTVEVGGGGTTLMIVEIDNDYRVTGMVLPGLAYAMAFDHSARRMVVGQVGGTVQVFDKATLELEATGSATPPVGAVAFLDEESIGVSHNGCVTVMDAALTSSRIMSGRHADTAMSIATNQTGLIATIDSRGMLLVQSAIYDQTLIRARAHAPPLSRVSFLPNGQWLFTWGYDNRLRVWSLGHTDQIAMGLSEPDGDLAVLESARSVVIATTGDALGLVARRLGTGKELARMPLPGPVLCAVYQPNRKRIVVVLEGGDLVAWDAGASEPEVLSRLERAPAELHVSADGLYLIGAMSDGLICLDADGQLLASTSWPVMTACVLPGDIAVYAGEDGVLHLVRLPMLNRLNAIESVAANVEMIRPSPCGGTIAVATDENTVLCVSLTSGDVLSVLKLPGPTTAMAWTPDGSRLLTGSEEPVVRMWDPMSGDLMVSWPEIGGAVTQIWCSEASVIARYSEGRMVEWSAERSTERQQILKAALAPTPVVAPARTRSTAKWQSYEELEARE